MPALIDDDGGSDRPGVGQAPDVCHVDSFFAESLHDELRVIVLAQGSRVRAAASHARGGHQGRGRQPAAMPLAAANLGLGVGRRIGVDVQQVVDRRVAKSENVDGFVHVVAGTLRAVLGTRRVPQFLVGTAVALPYPNAGVAVQLPPQHTVLFISYKTPDSSGADS